MVKIGIKLPNSKNIIKDLLIILDLPKVYASTKIVIDDVNRGAKNYGSINSRVYDAIASGTLVLTNGVIGAQETFNGKLPVWKSQEDLKNLIEYYLTNEDKKIQKLRI